MTRLDDLDKCINKRGCLMREKYTVSVSEITTGGRTMVCMIARSLVGDGFDTMQTFKRY